MSPGDPNPLATGGAFNPIAAINAANGAVKGQADPKTVLGAVKSAGSINDATTNIQAIVHAGNMVQAYDALGAMSPSQQASAWQGLSPAEQRSLDALGYKPPNLDALTHAGGGGAHGGIWSDVLSGLSDGLHEAEHGLGSAWHGAGIAVRDTMGALGAPIRLVQHLERARIALNEIGEHQGGMSWGQIAQKNAAGGLGGGLVMTQGHFWSLGDWAQAWDLTNNGNTQLDPAQYRVLVNRYGEQQVSFATRVGNAVASGGSALDNLITSYPQSQRQAVIDQIQDPKFQQLVTETNNAKISDGRMAVGSTFLNRNPTEGKVISGAIDATMDYMADPTMRGSAATEAYRSVRYAADSSSTIMDIVNSDSAVNRYIQDAGQLMAEGRYGELARKYPSLDTVAEELQRSGVDSPESFAQWLSDVGGMRAILSGDVAKISHRMPIMPHLNYLGWAKVQAKSALSHALDDLADGKVDLSDLEGELQADEISGAGDALMGAHEGQVQSTVDLLNKAKIASNTGTIPLVRNVARLVRRMSTYIPTHPYLDIGDGTADVTNFRRYLQGFLPQRMVDQVANVFVDSTEGERRDIVLGAIKQNFMAQGLYNTESGAEAADSWLADYRRFLNQAYSVNDIDKAPEDNGLLGRHAILDTQLSTRMGIPLPSEVRRVVREQSFLGAMGIDPMRPVEGYMRLWRTMILDRLGFPVRMSIDENGGRLLRNNPARVLASFIASGAAQTRTDDDIAAEVERAIDAGDLAPSQAAAETAHLKAMALKPLLPYHPVEHVLQIMSDRAPEGAREHISNAAEWYGAVMGGAVRRWARGAERSGLRAFGLGDYIDAATLQATYEPVWHSMDDVMAYGRGVEGFGWDAAEQARAMRMGGKSVIAKFNDKAPYSIASPNAFGYHFKWQVDLDQIANAKLGRAALESIDDGRDAQEDAVLRVLRDPDFASTRSRFYWAKALRNGKRVGIDATQDEADLSQARQVVAHVNALVRSGATPEGPVLRDIVDHMLEHGAAPPIDMLEQVAGRDLPAAVYGPDVVPVLPFNRFLDKSFEELVGRPMNWLTRQNHYNQAFTEALQSTRPWAEEVVGHPGPEADELAVHTATQRAVNTMIPYIHNPQLRTQFEDYHRNLFPFLFAQRQFLQRWGRTFADSPSAIRKIQLTMNGLRTMGVVKRDQNGDDYFYYPGSQYVTELIAGTLNRLGIHATIPFAAPFTGEVKYLMPGLANPTTPSVGPFAAVSMRELAKVFPEMTGFNQAVLQQGATEANWQQFVPSVVSRLYEALGPQEAGTQLASTTAMAIKYLDYAGQGLPNNPSEGQVERYVARVQNWARELLVVRAALGFILPATPTAQLDPSGLDARYKELLSVLPYDQATAEFIKEHPDATAYTVGATEAATEGGLPATVEDLDFTNANVGLAKDYPAAFPWIAPRSPGQFSLTEFYEQEATGQRLPKPIYDPTPGAHSVVTDIINARASGAYYQTVDNYEKAYNATTDTKTHQQLTAEYDAWKADYFQRNPLFAEYISSEAGHVSRMNTLRQVTQILADPRLPESPAVPPLRVMMGAWNTYTHDIDSISSAQSSQSAYDQKIAIKANAIAWGTAYAAAHPAVADFWNTILHPEIDDS